MVARGAIVLSQHRLIDLDMVARRAIVLSQHWLIDLDMVARGAIVLSQHRLPADWKAPCRVPRNSTAFADPLEALGKRHS
jgi:hypothetical protein